MSDKPISVGDLVQVVRPTTCCGITVALGRVHTVSGFFNDGFKCEHCGASPNSVLVALVDGKWGGYEASRLKRFPPLEDLKGVSEDARRPKTTEEFMKLVEEAQRQIREAS